MNVLMRKWQRVGPVTAAAGTAYTALLPNGGYGRLIVQRLSIKTGATAHTLSVMQVQAVAKAQAEAASAQKVLKITEASQNVLSLEAGDFVAYVGADGLHHVNTVASVATAAGVTSITMSANLGVVVYEGAQILKFGQPSEHEQAALAANSTVTFESEAGYFGANEKAYPVLLHVDNATNASTLEACVCPLIDA